MIDVTSKITQAQDVFAQASKGAKDAADAAKAAQVQADAAQAAHDAAQAAVKDAMAKAAAYSAAADHAGNAIVLYQCAAKLTDTDGEIRDAAISKADGDVTAALVVVSPPAAPGTAPAAVTPAAPVTPEVGPAASMAPPPVAPAAPVTPEVGPTPSTPPAAGPTGTSNTP